jgi:hypothetical protein
MLVNHARGSPAAAELALPAQHGEAGLSAGALPPQQGEAGLLRGAGRFVGFPRQSLMVHSSGRARRRLDRARGASIDPF